MTSVNQSMIQYSTPFKREIWEYQKSFIGTFAGIAAFTFIALMYALFRFSGYIEGADNFQITINGHPGSIDEFNFRAASTSYLSFIVFISLIVSVYYLLSCLYEDRRDRSILFWKSMPVSETQNILTKFITGLYVIPFIALAIGFISLLANTLVISIWAPTFTGLSFGQILTNSGVFSALWYEILFILLSGIWLTPFFAWLMLASSYSTKSPFLVAFIPPLLITIMEKVIFGTSTLLDFLKALIPNLELIAHSHTDTSILLREHLNTFTQGKSIFIGLVLAGLFISGAVWLRNNRYEI